jgi:hypothetical protein
MEWNNVEFEEVFEALHPHNMLALDVDNAREKGGSTKKMWKELEESFEETIEEYVVKVLGEQNSKYFFKAFLSKDEALSWIAEETDCTICYLDEDAFFDFVSEIRLVTFLSYSKGMTVRTAA